MNALQILRQQIYLRPSPADLQRGLEDAKASAIFEHERGLALIRSGEKWRHERAEIAREDREWKAQEAEIAYEAYEEEQKRRPVTEWEYWERERGTLGEYYPAPAPGCWKTRMTSDWYDDDRWEKVEENYSADRRSPGLFFRNRGLVNEEHYGAGRFSSLFKSPEEQEVTFAEANRTAKIYKRRQFVGG